MGRDLTLYPTKASRDDLKRYLEVLNFVKCKHFWDWPKGTLNYSWFDYQDFKSIDGVSADIYRHSSRVIYNGLVPFAISMFEYFFSQAFQILIKYDKVALNKRIEHRQKVDFETLLEIEQKISTVENVIAGNYTFQNLNQLNKAFKDWLGIDVRKILYKKKRIGNSVAFLENRISDIIQYRHGIVHHFVIDRSLTKDDYINILDTIEKGIREFISFIENKYSFKVVEHY